MPDFRMKILLIFFPVIGLRVTATKGDAMKGYAYLITFFGFCACTGVAATIGNAVAPGVMADARQQGGIEGKYDRFREVWTWKLHPMRVSATMFLGSGRDDEAPELRFGASVTSLGDESPTTLPITLLFDSYSRDWIFLHLNPSVTLILNGSERMVLGDAARDGRVAGGNVMEFLRLRVSDTVVRRLASSRTVEGQIGKTEFALLQGHIARFRAFLDTLDTLPRRGAAK
jgi:hypothetical protein